MKKQKKAAKNLVVSKKRSTFAPAKIGKHLPSKGSGFSAVGSAHVWGARGRWFESSNPDQKEKAENQQILGLLSFYQLSALFSI